MAELDADGVSVRQACYSLGVSPSGYYDWKTRAPSARSIRHAWLTDLIGQVHDASHGTYGQPRVLAKRTHGLAVGHNTVALLMRRAGLSRLPLRRRAKRVPAQKTVTDLVKRQFTAEGPNRLWVTDITEHPTREGKACCCVVLDVFSRRVVGWAIDSAQRADLAANALGMAIDSRRPSPGGIIHGDHGTQFTSWAYLQGEERRPAALARHGRRSLRQRGRRVILGAHAGRAAEPPAVGSSSPMRSSSTSRASTTADGATAPSAGPPR